MRLAGHTAIVIGALGIGALLGRAAPAVYRAAGPPPPPVDAAAAQPAADRGLPSPPDRDGDHGAAAARSIGAAAPLSVSAAQRPPLDELVARVKRMPGITRGRATYVQRVLRDLEGRGAAAVPVIADFLRRGTDVDFTAIRGGELVGERTLRLALIATLQRIGGSAAVAVQLEQLGQTYRPLEVAMLARGLEAEEPAAHTDAVLQTIDDALAWAGDARATPDLGPLFELLRGYGGARAVALLERSVPQWGEYALIALAELPDSAGVPTLTSLASTDAAPIENHVLPFQALAQATTRSPAAADALLELARSGRIPDQAWAPLADTLGGKHLQFSARMFDGTPLAAAEARSESPGPVVWRTYYIEWLNVRYQQDVVASEWTRDEVAQQLALIDELLETTSSPAATAALQRARASLQL